MLLVIAGTVLLFAMLIPVGFRLYRAQLVDDTSRLLVETLRRARAYAQSGRNDSAYGVKVVTASSSLVLFQGQSFSGRIALEDEILDYPSTVVITGTSTEAVFSRLYGTSTISETWTVTHGSQSLGVSINAQGVIDLE